MPPPMILNPATIDFKHVVADVHQIRAVNLQRFEMEALTAIVLLDRTRKIIAGYRDVTEADFWVRGHMPSFPLMPGVLLCETAAQLCSYYVITQKVFDTKYVAPTGNTQRTYDVSSDGQRFLMIKEPQAGSPSSAVGSTSNMVVVLNWLEEFTQRLPPK